MPHNLEATKPRNPADPRGQAFDSELMVLDRKMMVDRGYWLEHLSDPWEPVAPPTRRQAEATGERVEVEVELGADLSQQVYALAGDNDFLVYTIVVAAARACLQRYTGAGRPAVGSPARRGTEPFAAALVVVDELDPGVDFKSLLLAQRQTLLEAYAHQSYPVERLLGDLGASDAGLEGLFQVAVSLGDFHHDLGVERVPLCLSLRRGENCLGATLVFDPGRHRRRVVERFGGHLRRLLGAALDDPSRRVSALPMVGDVERRELLARAGEASFYERDASLGELFTTIARSQPGKLALTALDEDGEVVSQLTYGELLDRASRLAAALSDRGVGPGERVAVHGPRSAETLVSILAVILAGGAYVPLDPAYPPRALHRMLTDAHPRVLLRAGGPGGDGFAPSELRAGLDLEILDAAGLDGAAVAGGPPPATANDLAYLMYTSGSTGVPKGVAVPHRAVVRLVRQSDFAELEPETAFLQLAPLAFDASTLEIWGPWLNGGRVVVAPSGQPDLAALGGIVRASGVDSLWLTAGLFHQMVDGELECLAGLRQLLAGGDILSPEAVARVRERFPELRLVNGYGPTENTTFTCCHRVEEWEDGPVPVGRPVADTRVYVVDRGLGLAPDGVAGELVTGGDGLAQGYWRRPALTAERFVPDPFSERPGDRLYRTGDRVRWADGVVHFLGRIDGQAKVRGFRVEPGEVEAVLGRHPQVARAAVAVRGGGAEDKRLAAWVVPAAVPAPTPSDLRDWLAERLPAHMVPGEVAMVQGLPLNANGKVDRAALADLDTGAGRPYLPPRTPVESMLAELWQELLGVERVGADDDFFELGGHSLLATRLASRLRQAFSVEVPVRDVFENPTVAGLGRTVEAALSGAVLADASIVPVSRDQVLPLSFAQQRLWFIHRLEPEDTAYNMFLALRMKGDLDPGALSAAFDEILRRHETLRTRFVLGDDGAPRQEVLPPESRSLPMVDLDSLAAQLRERELARVGRAEASRPFDLSVAPLVRFRLVRIAPVEHIALLTLHHVIGDGWSLGVLMREMSALHAAAAEGRPAALPELPIQYADFTVWQRRWLAGEAMSREVDYWRRQLEGIPSLLHLPTDRPRPAMRSTAGDSLTLTLSADRTRELYALAQRHQATLFMVLLAVFQVLLHRLSEEEDIVVGTPVAARNRLELEGLIGFFVNTLVLRQDFSDTWSFPELVAGVREVSLEAHRHQNLPFEHLVEELEPERDLSWTPLFQVMFSLENTPQEAIRLGPVELEPAKGLAPSYALFDLDLAVAEGPSLTLVLSYSTALFDRVTAERWTGYLDTLLSAVVEEPDGDVRRLSMLSDAERSQLIREWSTGGDVAAPALAEGLPHEVILDRARRHPGEIAVQDADVSLTYRQLVERAAATAALLREQGVEPGEPVGLYARRTAGTIAALLGILFAGAAYLPLHPRQGERRLREVVEDSGMRLAVDGGEGPREVDVGLDFLAPGAAARPAAKNLPRVPGSGLAYVIYTSGSTGRPKGVAISHRSLAAFTAAAAASYGVSGDDRVLQFSALSFDASVEEIFTTLVQGATLLLLSSERGETPGDFLEGCARRGVTVLPLATAYWHLLVDAVGKGEAEWPDSLRLVILGGEEPAIDRMLAWSRQAGDGVRLVNTYGPTEATVVATRWWHPRPGEAAIHRRVPMGRATEGMETYLLNRKLEPTPTGVPGELYLAGAGLARGYLGRPGLTAEAFVPHPFGEGERLYRTGDLARWEPGGLLTFLGRRDHQVKMRGFRIELGEVEAHLSALPEVRAAVVTLRRDLPGGPGLVAYVEPASVSVARVRQALRESLPDYMVPGHFVALDSLPTTVSAKLDRDRLPSPGTLASSEDDHRPPRDPVELRLARIWEEVLERDRISIADSFFDLGGHSLLAVHLVSRIEQEMGVAVSLQLLFQNPTVESLALQMEGQRSREAEASLVGIQPQGTKPPLYCVHASGGSLLSYVALARHLGEDQPVYGFQSRGIDGRGLPLDSLPAMARRYVGEMRRHQPRGPYRLLGWSMGGLIAFEMTRLLEAEGESVEPLVVLDAAIALSPPDGGSSREDSLAMLAGFAQDLGLPLDELPGGREVEEMDPDERLEALLDEAHRRGVVPASYGGSYLFRVFQANVAAMASYRPEPWDGRVVLLRAAEAVPPDGAPTYGWSDVAREVTVRDVPGDHYEVLREPHVGDLAAELSSLLEET